MEWNIFAVIVCAVFTAPCAALADNHTITLGYSHNKASSFIALKGATVKYRYEWHSPVSIIGSLSWSRASEEDSRYNGFAHTHAKEKITYTSLAAGPAWRINDFVSLYALAGLSHVKDSYSSGYTYSGVHYSWDDKFSRTQATYGFGVQINPWGNVAIDIGYEGTKVQQAKVHGFNVGVGYRF